MNFQEMLAAQGKPRMRNKPKDEEHRLQSACIRWFRYQYPSMKHNLFSVPNGGRRDAVTAAKMKEEGALAGVSDLILLKANRFYHGLLIEMKTSKGRQSDNQKEWEQKIINDGFKYIVVRSLEQFMEEITKYLKDE